MLLRCLMLPLSMIGLIASASCSSAGLLPSAGLARDGELIVNFQPASAPIGEGVFVSDGAPYSADRGMGWDKDIRNQTRLRKSGSHGICFLGAVATEAVFTLDLPDGDYLFEVTSRDTDFGGVIAPTLDGQLTGHPVSFGTERSASVVVPVTSKNGKARIGFVGGRAGMGNSLISSIRVVPASNDPDLWRKSMTKIEAYQEEARTMQTYRLEKQARERASYAAITLHDMSSGKETYDLCGRWLFSPSQELADASDGPDPSASDLSYHILDVPQFWQPIKWWIYNTGRGTSHNYTRSEILRCQNYTFDYQKTTSGYYRQWIEVPASMRGKRMVVKFAAASSVADVYWNGKKVGSHVGMFGPFECEVTPHVRFGEKNLLSVLVTAGKADEKAAEEVAALAVSVEVTKEMLNLLPRGGYWDAPGGIWQPVVLEVTDQDKIADVFFNPRLDGADIETTINRTTGAPLSIRYLIADAATGKVLHADKNNRQVPDGRGDIVLNADISGLHPKLWSPEHPNLYLLKTRLFAAGKQVDESVVRVGFRTFEARGNRLYLNGKPYFLRGANMPPHGLRPNDAALADKFMKLMHDGNEMVTRTHMSPFTKVWLDAADKNGVGVSIEGTWPWLCLFAIEIPDSKMLKIWKTEFLEVIRSMRNHPSILLYTVSN